MYYLGKHKGSPDDKYTHSSTVWESFTKDDISEGVTRRILAYGTDEEMCLLEHELLKNRKKRCWDRYYNNSLGDPRYVDQSGENNPMYGKFSELVKKLWEDPEFRKMKSEEMVLLNKKQWEDPEHRKMQSERNKGKNNPNSRENRAKRKAENFTDAVLPF
jgi:hypothetical protein